MNEILNLVERRKKHTKNTKSTDVEMFWGIIDYRVDK